MRYIDPQDEVPRRPQQPPAVGGAQTGADEQQQPSAPNSEFSIPNSSVYLNETSAANTAYEKAKAQLLANRNSLYHQYGLSDTGAVDINNPYGQYQMLLGSEGRQLDTARNNSIGRGLGTGGLANQDEASLIPGMRLEQLGFQRNVDQAGSDYSSGLLDAENSRTSAINQAYQDALQDALARGLFDPSPTGDPTTTTTSAGGTTTKTNAKKPAIFTPATKPYAVKVTANKTGASANKKQGIFSIH